MTGHMRYDAELHTMQNFLLLLVVAVMGVAMDIIASVIFATNNCLFGCLL